VSYERNPDIQYIHKVTGDRNLFCFANLGGNAINTRVELRGRYTLESFNPHTGDIHPMDAVTREDAPGGSSVTGVRLSLKPYHCCFWVEKR